MSIDIAVNTDEVFKIRFSYQRNPFELTVTTDYPSAPECFGCDYFIYDNGIHLYTLNHCKNEDEIYCWEIKKKPATGHDPEFAQAIGEAIDKHYQ